MLRFGGAKRQWGYFQASIHICDSYVRTSWNTKRIGRQDGVIFQRLRLQSSKRCYIRQHKRREAPMTALQPNCEQNLTRSEYEEQNSQISLIFVSKITGPFHFYHRGSWVRQKLYSESLVRFHRIRIDIFDSQFPSNTHSIVQDVRGGFNHAIERLRRYNDGVCKKSARQKHENQKQCTFMYHGHGRNMHILRLYIWTYKKQLEKVSMILHSLQVCLMFFYFSGFSSFCHGRILQRQKRCPKSREAPRSIDFAGWRQYSWCLRTILRVFRGSRHSSNMRRTQGLPASMRLRHFSSSRQR